MRTLICLLAVFMSLCAVAQETKPEVPRALSVASLGVYDLLTRNDVQQDLALSAQTRIDFSRIRREMLDEALKVQITKDKPEVIGPKIDAIRQAHQAKVAEILTDDQKLRLKQIELQLLGGLVILHADVAPVLNLDEKQMERVGKIQEARNGEMRAFTEKIRSKQETFAVAMKTYEKRVRELDGDLLKVLNREQSEKLKGILGKPFKTDEMKDDKKKDGGG